ncbi:MAG: VWA domain-containing protein [Magnetococcales bacterium]|nr:VWA domain-containing protein [Magnetococcales bacterium]
MVELIWPWMLVFIVFPWVLIRFLPEGKPVQEAALRMPALERFCPDAVTVEVVAAPGKRITARFIMAWLIWSLVVVAGARPQWTGKPMALPLVGRDLMMAVDLSGSMSTQDFLLGDQMVDRLTATQYVASEFIERRVGDRLGLILFGRQAYLQTPLTFDRQTVRTFLGEAVVGLAGKETAIGDAIGLAVKKVRDGSAPSRVLILLTDGANTAGELEPLKAAELAANEGLRIHTIGVGADEMIIRSFFGNRKVNPSSDLDEKALTGIAEKTGGHYFRARDVKALEGVYEQLDKLEPIAREDRHYRPIRTLFHWPLGAAFVLAVLLGLVVGIGNHRKGQA